MNIILSILYDKCAAVIATERDAQVLRDEAYDRCHQEAERRNIYYSAALENLSLYSKFEPMPDAVREFLGEEQVGDWRACMTQAAILATIGHLETEVEADLTKIEKAIHEATLAGFEARKVYATCANGWAAHDREEEWTHGTLYLWMHLEGEFNAAMLQVKLSEGGEAWLDLAWVD